MFEISAAESPTYPPELRDAWKRIQEGMDQLTDSIHFEKLVEEGAAKRSMYYI